MRLPFFSLRESNRKPLFWAPYSLCKMLENGTGAPHTPPLPSPLGITCVLDKSKEPNSANEEFIIVIFVVGGTKSSGIHLEAVLICSWHGPWASERYLPRSRIWCPIDTSDKVCVTLSNTELGPGLGSRAGPSRWKSILPDSPEDSFGLRATCRELPLFQETFWKLPKLGELKRDSLYVSETSRAILLMFGT